jgi:LysM repeat protein
MRSKFLTLGLLLVLILTLVPAGSTSAQCPGTTHVVTTGENLFRIGLAYGLTVDQVAAANGIVNVNDIKIAQVLCIPTGGNVGTGGPTTSTGNSTIPPGQGGALVDTGGAITLQSGSFVANRASNTVVNTVLGGTVDSLSGYTTTATIRTDAANNVVTVVSYGHIPNSQVRIYFSSALGDISGGVAGTIIADSNGLVDGWSEIPFISGGARQYVMARSYDGRMTWGYADLGNRFP